MHKQEGSKAGHIPGHRGSGLAGVQGWEGELGAAAVGSPIPEGGVSRVSPQHGKAR